MIKAAEVALVLVIGLPIVLAFLSLPVMALVWLRKGKIFVPPGRGISDRGIILRHEEPVSYWLSFLFEMTLAPLIAVGILGGVLSAVTSILSP